MYSSSYSQVNKLGSGAQKKMQYRSKGKSCGYYMRIIFFFSSLIQSLIIVSLVLFLIYGKTQDSASSDGVQNLEMRFSQLSIENSALQAQRKNLTNLLNITITEKAKNDWDLALLRAAVNNTIGVFYQCDINLQQCNNDLTRCKLNPGINPTRLIIPQPSGGCDCGVMVQQMRAGLQLLESNFTQTKMIMHLEKEEISKERDKLVLEAIRLRRDKSAKEKELELLRANSKEQIFKELGSVSTVSKALLEKIDSLFPTHLKFQLTCPKQREYFDQIQTNCTSLSREVENTLQHYLNNVGDQLSNLLTENNHLKAENWLLSDDYRLCSQNRTSMMEQNRRSREELQLKHDQEREKLLLDKMKMTGEMEVLKNTVKYKDAEVDRLKVQINHLNLSCMGKSGPGGYSGPVSSSRSNTQYGLGSFGGGGSSYSSSSSSSVSQGRAGTVGSAPSYNSGSGFNRASSTGPDSSQTLTGAGQVLNKPGSTFQQPGSSTSLSSVGSGGNKPASTGGAFPNIGSSWTGSNKPAESGRSSTTLGSSLGSVGSSLNQGSSGTSLNKAASSGKNSPGYGSGPSSASSSSSGSSGSASKTSSSGFSWLGLGGSTSGQSKTGGLPGKTSGSGSWGTGSVFGGGRTNGVAGGSVVSQHILELQRLISPPGPQEKQELSRMIG